MFNLSNWTVVSGSPVGSKVKTQALKLLWQDSATSLNVWQFGSSGDCIYRLRLGLDLVVDIHPDGRIITRPRAHLPQITIDHFLADQVFPRLLAHGGSLVIHAGAFQFQNSAVLLMGRSGRGKSTLSASFNQAGFYLLGDDAMVISSIDGIPEVRAVYPSLRLFPDSIEALMPNVVTTGPVAHYTTKQRIDVGGASPSGSSPLPIHAIILIGEPAVDGEIRLRRLSIATSCISLVENSFALNPANVTQAGNRLKKAGSVARRIPTFDITYPRDFSRLPEVHQVILDKIASLDDA